MTKSSIKLLTEIGPDGASGNVVETMHAHQDDGQALHLSDLSHGTAHPNRATVTGVAGTTISVASGSIKLTKGALRHGWTVQIADGSGTTVVVQQINLANDGHTIASFTVDSVPANLVVDAILVWDPVDEGTFGHIHSGFYNPPTKPNDPKAGWCLVLRPADAPADGSKDFVIYPDGTTMQGTTIVTQPNGVPIGLDDLAAGGSALAKGLEGSGVILFDAGEYDSSTQEAQPYTGTTPGTVITPDTSNFYGGAPTAIQASWLKETTDGKTGDADAILQMSTLGNNSSVRFWDPQIVDEDGHVRTYKVKHNVTLEFPVYLSTTGASVLTLGASTTLVNDAAIGATELYIDHDPAALGAAAGQQWVINPGGSTQETVALGTPDETGLGLRLTAGTAHAHSFGESIILAALSNGTKVNSGSILDGTIAVGDAQSAIDAISIGFLDSNGLWYRAWWGDPTWIIPWGSGNATHLGKLTTVAGQWTKLAAKCSDLGVWTKGAPPVTLVGVEIGIYSAVGPQTVYFDAHSAGTTGSRDKSPSGGTGPSKQPPQSSKSKHKLPVHHADSHVHSDLMYWVDSSNVVHWGGDAGVTGELVTHDGHTFAIRGGTEDDPNAGITGHAGDYLVFNTSSSQAIQVKDPVYGTVTIPAYSATGGTGGQSTGFGVLSESFNWSGRPGGGSVKQGPVDNLCKVGKLSKSPDLYTGSLTHYSGNGNGKGDGKKQQKGSIGRPHQAKHNTNRHKHKNIVYSFTKAVSATSPYTWQDTLKWGAGTVTDESGASLGTLNGSSMTVYNDDVIVYDSTNHVLVRYANPALGGLPNLDRHDSKRYFPIGEIVSSPDPQTGALYFHGWGHGHHQNAGNQHAKSSVGRHHNHHSVPHRGHFVGARFTMAGTQLEIGANGPANGTAMPYYQSDSPLTKTGVSKLALSPSALSTGSDGSDGTTFTPTISFPDGHSMGAEAIIFFDPTNGTYGSWYGAAQGTDTTTPGKYSPDYTLMVKVGHVSTVADHDGTDYIFHPYHVNSHTTHANHLKNSAVKEKHVGQQQLHGGENSHRDHHAANSHSKRHDMHHKPGKYVHHDTTFECVGTSLYVNYADGGWTPTFTSTLKVDDGNVYYISPGIATVSAGTVVYINATSGAGGTYTPSVSGYDPSNDKHFFLCEIGPADAFGNLTTNGHHHGPHKVHEKHLKQKAVKAKHHSFKQMFAWTSVGAVAPPPTTAGQDGSHVAISPPSSLDFTPPASVTLDELHGGHWKFGLSQGSGQGGPDNASVNSYAVSNKRHMHHNGADAFGDVITETNHALNFAENLNMGSLAYPGTWDNTQKGIIINDITLDSETGTVHVGYQTFAGNSWTNTGGGGSYIYLWMAYWGFDAS